VQHFGGVMGENGECMHSEDTSRIAEDLYFSDTPL
jgi:hypothetical protein